MIMRRSVSLMAMLVMTMGCEPKPTDVPAPTETSADQGTQIGDETTGDAGAQGSGETTADTAAENGTETPIEAARRVELEALRRGAPGVTTPVYDPSLADEPGRSFATQEEALAATEEREARRRARDEK
jgi:hypothetical protein